MASGCAVIASNRGGIPEAAGGAAALVDPDDLDAVVNQLNHLVTNHELLSSFKQNARTHALESSWENSIEKFLNLL